MPYVDPMDTYSDNDLIPTADINQWIGNIDYLHSRPFTLTAPGLSSTAYTIVGDWAAKQVNNVGAATHETVFLLAIPDHFAALVSAEIMIFATTSYTAEFDINTDYNEPSAAAPENYNQHSGALLNETLALTANKTLWIDISSTLTSLAGGDVLAVKIMNSTGANAGNWYTPLLKLVYTASDTVP